MIPERIIILAAMESEIAFMRKKMLIEKEEHYKKYSLYWGQYLHHKIVLLKSGVGKKNIQRILKVIDNIPVNRVKCILHIGLAGAVVPYLKIGDIIVPQELMNINRNNNSYYADQYLLRKIDQLIDHSPKIKKKIYYPHLVTSNVICSKKEKQIILQQYPQAGAVDMEAFYIGQYCTENRVPFLLIKAISDTYDFTFPRYYLTKEKFTLSDYPKLLGIAVSKPQEIIAAIKLKNNCRAAIKNNYKVIEKYLRIL